MIDNMEKNNHEQTCAERDVVLAPRIPSLQEEAISMLLMFKKELLNAAKKRKVKESDL